MTSRGFSRFLTAFCFAAITAGSAAAQTTKAFEPYSGQPGKDVVWVPPPRRWSTACSTWRR